MTRRVQCFGCGEFLKAGTACRSCKNTAAKRNSVTPELPFDEWWKQLLETAKRSGHTPGMPDTWREYNWARNQTPQEAYDAEYNEENWRMTTKPNGDAVSVSRVGSVGKYDEVLKPFMGMMEKELHANSDKGDRPGWLSMSADTCMLEIYYHLGKLQKAVKDGNGDGICEFAADVANLSMMLTDICGALNLFAAAQPATAKVDEAERRIAELHHVGLELSGAISEYRQTPCKSLEERMFATHDRYIKRLSPSADGKVGGQSCS